MDLTLLPESTGRRPSLIKQTLLLAWELIKIVVIAVVIIVPVRLFVMQPFYVKGASMETTYHDHEYLLIDKLTYQFRPPGRGEVVVFRNPLDPRDFFIKRIIGLPGETVEVNGVTVTIYNASRPQGMALDEPYTIRPPAGRGEPTPTVLGPDEYFVMGDNRPESKDSRSIGPVSRTYISGRVMLRILPLQRLGWMLPVPAYGL